MAFNFCECQETISRHIISYHIMSYHIISCHIISYLTCYITLLIGCWGSKPCFTFAKHDSTTELHFQPLLIYSSVQFTETRSLSTGGFVHFGKHIFSINSRKWNDWVHANEHCVLDRWWQCSPKRSHQGQVGAWPFPYNFVNTEYCLT
jgi:hypothetical protein